MGFFKPPPAAIPPLMTKESTTTTQAVLDLFRAFGATTPSRSRMTSQAVYDRLIDRRIITEELPIANVRSSIRQLEKRGDIKRLQVSETGQLGHRMNLYMLAPPTPKSSTL